MEFYPEPPPLGLRVLYAIDNQLYLWKNGRSQPLLAGPIAPSGEPAFFRLSKDGEIIAYVQEGGLWTVNSDGSENHLRLDNTSFVFHPNLDWLPDSHLLLLNDREIFDADHGKRWNFIDPALTGKVIPSPDGQRLAIVRPNQIRTVRTDGSEDSVQLDFPPLCAPAQAAYYPEPVWASDSTRLVVILPEQRAFCSDEPMPSTVWSLPVPGGEPVIISTFVFEGLTSISPGLALAAGSATSYDETLQQQVNQISIINLASGSVAPVWNESGAKLSGWTPDSLYYTYFSEPGRVFVRGDLVGGAQQITLPGSTAQLKWINTEQFLYTRNQQIFLATPGWIDRWIADLGANDSLGIFQVEFANP